MVRAYARVAGLLLLALGAAGFLSGGERLFGLFNTDPWENAVHLMAGVLLLHAGFLNRDDAFARIVVAGLGLAFLLVGVVGFLYPKLFGLIPGGLTVADDLLHLALGVLAVAAVELPRRETRAGSGAHRGSANVPIGRR